MRFLSGLLALGLSFWTAQAMEVQLVRASSGLSGIASMG